MARFYVNQMFRLAAAKIFCSSTGGMLVEASGDIDSDTGVERVVGTEDDIDVPVYGSHIGHSVRTFKGDYWYAHFTLRGLCKKMI